MASGYIDANGYFHDSSGEGVWYVPPGSTPEQALIQNIAVDPGIDTSILHTQPVTPPATVTPPVTPVVTHPPAVVTPPATVTAPAPQPVTSAAGGTMQRLYIYYAPGVTTDPTTGGPIASVDALGIARMGNPDGVYWTGVYDPASGCATASMAFLTFQQMAAYAQAHGETLVPFQNAQQVISFCQRVSGASWPSRSPAPVTGPAPGPPAGGSLFGGLSGTTLLLLAVGAYFLFGGKKSST